MKIIFSLLLFFTTVIASNGQTIFNDSIAPKIEFTEWINNPKEISVIKDKPVVLEFWSTWCGPCIAAIPHFNQLTEKYDKEITFISVNSYEGNAIVENFLLKNPMLSYVALDENETLKKAFNVQTIPVTILIDKNRMLRWRGITTELTDEILATFLSENTFKNVDKKGIILDKIYTIDTLEDIKYHLLIDHGDKTLGKGITTDFEDGFFLKLSNYEIYSILPTLSEWLKQEDYWKFEGKLLENEIMNVSIKNYTKITSKGVTKKILDDVVLRLEEKLNFRIKSSEEIQEVWYIMPNTSQLEKFLSIDQTLDINVLEQTEEYTKYKNVFFDFLASSFSTRTKAKVEYHQPEPVLRYDLTISKTNDILEMKKYLKNTYGIELVKKEIKVKVKTAIFK